GFHSCLYSAALLSFFTDTTPTQIYTLSLHDALPISASSKACGLLKVMPGRRSLAATHRFVSLRLRTGRRLIPPRAQRCARGGIRDRKSTRLNSSHGSISYAVFCLKKKNR